jgi:elongator complex protein 3
VHAYHARVRSGEWAADPALLRRLRMKPIRTLSGVTTVTVLTKPYPCPGKCVFCPTDLRMPKSYLPDEPGAARALENDFDPFRQTASRLEALHSIGHPTDKIELLILGGTWSAYPRAYQTWFVQRCLDAMNGFDSVSLEQAQVANEGAARRNVGLVIETRPDHVSPAEVRHLRMLGVTKVQLGAQSLEDAILELNRRGHTVAELRQASSRLRRAGFKLVLHWMPNLLGATLESDRLDFARLWDDAALRPDELKIYPCQLLEMPSSIRSGRKAGTRLLDGGAHRPAGRCQAVDPELLSSQPRHPRYPFDSCRRRQSAHEPAPGRQAELARRGTACRCIRCREVRQGYADPQGLRLHEDVYDAGGGEEHFLSLVTEADALAAYARVSLPSGESPLPELHRAALLRELHVVGPSLEFGSDLAGAPQHSGLGARLLNHAETVAGERGYARLAVISALGTRGYYRRAGYSLDGTYMVRDLSQGSG